MATADGKKTKFLRGTLSEQITIKSENVCWQVPGTINKPSFSSSCLDIVLFRIYSKYFNYNNIAVPFKTSFAPPADREGFDERVMKKAWSSILQYFPEEEDLKRFQIPKRWKGIDVMFSVWFVVYAHFKFPIMSANWEDDGTPNTPFKKFLSLITPNWVYKQIKHMDKISFV